jgi:hypothetical protein
MTKPSLKDILRTIKEWELESKNPRNDGWTQEGYREKLKKLFNEAGKLLNKK